MPCREYLGLFEKIGFLTQGNPSSFLAGMNFSKLIWGNNNFNVIDLTPFDIGTQALNLRPNSLQEGEDDIYIEGQDSWV
ncbi:hypothetical protein CR513_39894, partial [Mucuna pruriens]